MRAASTTALLILLTCVGAAAAPAQNSFDRDSLDRNSPDRDSLDSLLAGFNYELSESVVVADPTSAKEFAVTRLDALDIYMNPARHRLHRRRDRL